MPIMKMTMTIAGGPSCRLRVNGPPRKKIVSQLAKPRRMSAAVAVSRGPQRSAAHSGGSTARTASGAALRMSAANGPKASAPNAPAAAKIAVVSKNEGRSNARG